MAKKKDNMTEEKWAVFKAMNTNPVVRVWTPAGWAEHQRRERARRAAWRQG